MCTKLSVTDFSEKIVKTEAGSAAIILDGLQILIRPVIQSLFVSKFAFNKTVESKSYNGVMY